MRDPCERGAGGVEAGGDDDGGVWTSVWGTDSKNGIYESFSRQLYYDFSNANVERGGGFVAVIRGSS